MGKSKALIKIPVYTPLAKNQMEIIYLYPMSCWREYSIRMEYCTGNVFFMARGGLEHWNSIYNKLLKINVPVVRELCMSEQDRALYQECFKEPVLPTLTDTMEPGLTERQNNFVAYFRHMLSKEYVIPAHFNDSGDLPL